MVFRNATHLTEQLHVDKPEAFYCCLLFVRFFSSERFWFHGIGLGKSYFEAADLLLCWIRTTRVLRTSFASFGLFSRRFRELISRKLPLIGRLVVRCLGGKKNEKRGENLKTTGIVVSLSCRESRLINHRWAMVVMYGLTERPSSRNDRFLGEHKHCGICSFFPVNKIKTNTLPLATKDLVLKTSKSWQKITFSWKI